MQIIIDNKYYRLLLYISFYLFIYNEYLFFSIGIYGGDTSIFINQYQFLSSLIESISVKSFSNIEPDLEVTNNGIVILKSLIDYFLYLVSDSIEFSKKFFFSSIFILSIYFLDKIFVKFEINKIASIVIIIFYLSTFSILDNFIMGWDFVLIQIFLSPILFYFYILYYEKSNLIYIFIINLISIFLVISIQNIFLCIITFLIFFLLNLKAHKENLYIFISLFITLLVSLFPIIINNYFFAPTQDIFGNVSNSTITKGINGILRPLFSFKSTSHLSSNFFFHTIASLGPLYKFYFSLVNTLGFAGLALMYYNNFKYKNLCFLVFLLDFFLIILKFESNTNFLTNFFDIKYATNLSDLFFTIFRDLARLSSINDFIFFITAGYFLNHFFKILKIFIKNNSTIIRVFNHNIFLLIILILFVNENTFSNFIKNYTYSKSDNFSEKQMIQDQYTEYLIDSEYSNFLFLPLSANVKLNDIGLFSKNKNAETLDPFKRFSLKNIFYWNTDKNLNLKVTSQINKCNKSYNKDLKDLSSCLSDIDKLNFGVSKNNFDAEEIKLISNLFILKNFQVDFESADVIIFIKKDYKYNFDYHGINIIKMHDTNNQKIENLIEFHSSRNFNFNYEKNFFKLFINQYIHIFDLFVSKIKNKHINDKHQKLYYLKNQLYNDLAILAVIFLVFFNLTVLLMFRKSLK